MATFRQGACSSCQPSPVRFRIWRWPPAKQERCICSIAPAWADLRPAAPTTSSTQRSIGLCWCGPSYFTGPDGVGRVVSSGGVGGLNTAQIVVWKVQTSPTVAFVAEGAALPVASGQDGGTFTTVSSNGTQAGTAIIWATGRPTDPNTPAAVNLYAFAATPSSGTLPLLLFLAGRSMAQR